MAKYKNTLQRGSVRYLVFGDGSLFFGVALEFNLMVEGTNSVEALVLLNEAVSGYIESARKIKARPAILNQNPDPEYEKMWRDYHDLQLKKKYEKVLNSLPIFNAGWLELAKR